jgi:hypothetical protein
MSLIKVNSIVHPSGTSNNITLDTAGNIKVSNSMWFNSSEAPSFYNANGASIGTTCRAWVNINGANGQILASYNVSSVTYNATGDYTVNFANNTFSDSNYSFACGIQREIAGAASIRVNADSTGKTSSSIRLYATFGSSGSTFNPASLTLIAFR